MSSTSAAERVAELLLAFRVDVGGGAVDRSVSELSRTLNRERSQVSRMLAALRRSGIVEQDFETRRYRLGWSMRVVAAGAGDQALVRAARPALQALVARTGEVALLSVQEGNRCLTVMREESAHSLRGGGWVGRRSPMHHTASGRALLFDASEETVEALTADDLADESKHGPMSPRNLAELVSRLDRERRQGFSCASEEVEVGLTSIGVPVRSWQGEILAVLNVSGPTSRVIDLVDPISKLLIAASAAVSRSILSGDPA